MQDFMTVKEAAAFIGLSESTLNHYRLSGDGPRFFRLGRLVRYDRNDLVEWARSRPAFSTSDAA